MKLHVLGGTALVFKQAFDSIAFLTRSFVGLYSSSFHFQTKNKKDNLPYISSGNFKTYNNDSKHKWLDMLHIVMKPISAKMLEVAQIHMCVDLVE